MLRILRRFTLLVIALLIPFYAVSFTESLTVPPAWREIGIGDDHASVRNRLRASGMADNQCEWLVVRDSVRCTLVGRHHAAGIEVFFDRPGSAARVAEVHIHEPRYTGPFHLHARLRNASG
ncbi:MAG: hypothetical protein KDI82_12025 [Gammaproteobacteria bacterium]|nr:hypothetical protein [Gammaproteobacteria bacterium]